MLCQLFKRLSRPYGRHLLGQLVAKYNSTKEKVEEQKNERKKKEKRRRRQTKCYPIKRNKQLHATCHTRRLSRQSDQRSSDPTSTTTRLSLHLALSLSLPFWTIVLRSIVMANDLSLSQDLVAIHDNWRSRNDKIAAPDKRGETATARSHLC